MKYSAKFLLLFFLMLTPIFLTIDSQKIMTLSDSQYLDAFRDLQPGWTSETIYQTSPLGPISICETSTNEVLILDQAGKAILELELNGNVSSYLSIGDLTLDAIAYQPNAERVIGLGNGAFYTINETSIEVIIEHPPFRSFSTMVVDPTDDSIYTGHWSNDSSIYHFNSNGEYLSTIRSQILGCTQVAVDGPENLLYYAETFLGRITRLNMTTNTTTVLTSGIAIPGTGEGIGLATDPVGDLYYYVAEGIEKGFYKYNGTDFDNIMGAKLGTGPITWSEKFNSFLCTPGYGACVVQYDPIGIEPKRVTPTVNTRSIIQTPDGKILIGIERTIYSIESGIFSEFIPNLPFPCSNLVMDNEDRIYASLSNDSVSILEISPDGTNTTWFRKDMMAFPSAITYDSKNNWMILMTSNYNNDTFDLWRLPIDNPYDYSKIGSIENVTSGDFTVDRSGNIYVLERSKNILYKIPDGTDQTQVLFTDMVEHAYLVYPHIAYSTDADAIILCRNDDLEAWPVDGSSSYILGVSATGIDHEGLFENPDGDLVGTHSGQIFKLLYDGSTSTTTSPETSTTTESPAEPTTTPEDQNPFPFEILSVGAGVAIVIVLVIVCVKKKT